MKLLKLTLVVFLQLYLGATHSKTSPSIVIIGAGPAGVAATTKLLENGYRNVVVLEAENRIGGRVHSVFFGEAVIDLGAEWCHGSKDNIVYELMKDFNIFGHTEVPRTIYHSSVKNIEQDFGNELVDIMDSIYVPDGHRDEIEGKTLGHYCIEKFNTSIHEKYSKSARKLEVAKSSLDFFHHYVLSSEGAFSWFEPSAQSDYKDCEGDLNLNWNGLGYKTALEVLIKKFPDPSKQLPFDQTVLLNKQVTKVLWNDTTSRVHCADNSIYEADHVIFTPSIGVLKENHQQIFEPPLPQAKAEAIKHIGFGGVMKIAMHFKDNWWSKRNFTGFNFIWSEDDKASALKEFPEGPLKEGRLWVTEIFSLMPVEHNPKVMVAWVTGDLVPQIELLNNDTLIHGITFVMNKFLGHHYNVTAPDSLLRTTWYTNPHFRGTYSYQTPEARKKNNGTAETELAKPLTVDGTPRVQFAGEASHPYFYSTVHGAIETGHREANRIIDLYK